MYLNKGKCRVRPLGAKRAQHIYSTEERGLESRDIGSEKWHCGHLMKTSQGRDVGEQIMTKVMMKEEGVK